MAAKQSASAASTRASKIIKAPRAAVYRACIDPDAVAAWRVPDNMAARVHAFDAREGGGFRISLTYADIANRPRGKSSEDTDTFEGRFVELIPDRRVVELIRFETNDAGLAGEMKITTSLADVAGGTRMTLSFENIPPGIRAADNREGTRQSLKRLAKLLEKERD